MPDGEQYRWVIGQVRDTGDKLGPGGTRRTDGTQSAQVRNLSYLERDEAPEASPIPYEEPPKSFRRDLAEGVTQQVIEAAFEVLVSAVIVPQTKKLWNERVVPAVNRKRQERRAKRAGDAPAEWTDVVDAELVDDEPMDSPMDLEVADEPTSELSRDEAEWRIAGMACCTRTRRSPRRAPGRSGRGCA